MITGDLVSAGGKIGRVHAIVGKTIFVKFETKNNSFQVYPFVKRQVKVCSNTPVRNVIPNPIIHPLPKV